MRAWIHLFLCNFCSRPSGRKMWTLQDNGTGMWSLLLRINTLQKICCLSHMVSILAFYLCLALVFVFWLPLFSSLFSDICGPCNHRWRSWGFCFFIQEGHTRIWSRILCLLTSAEDHKADPWKAGYFWGVSSCYQERSNRHPIYDPGLTRSFLQFPFLSRYNLANFILCNCSSHRLRFPGPLGEKLYCVGNRCLNEWELHITPEICLEGVRPMNNCILFCSK